MNYLTYSHYYHNALLLKHKWRGEKKEVLYLIWFPVSKRNLFKLQNISHELCLLKHCWRLDLTLTLLSRLNSNTFQRIVPMKNLLWLVVVLTYHFSSELSTLHRVCVRAQVNKKIVSVLAGSFLTVSVVIFKLNYNEKKCPYLKVKGWCIATYTVCILCINTTIHVEQIVVRTNKYVCSMCMWSPSFAPLASSTALIAHLPCISLLHLRLQSHTRKFMQMITASQGDMWEVQVVRQTNEISVLVCNPFEGSNTQTSWLRLRQSRFTRVKLHAKPGCERALPSEGSFTLLLA